MRLCCPNDRPVDGLDFGLPAGAQVLQHRRLVRPVVGQGVVDLGENARLVDGDPGRRSRGDGLRDDLTDQGTAVVVVEPAHGQASESGQWVERGIERRFLPNRRPDLRIGDARDARAIKQGSDLLQPFGWLPVGGPQADRTGAVRADMGGAGQIGWCVSHAQRDGITGSVGRKGQ